MSSPNVDAVRAFYEASTRDGLEGIMPLLDEQIEWRNPEDSADAAVWRGQQGVRDWFAHTRQSFDEAHFTPETSKNCATGGSSSSGASRLQPSRAASRWRCRSRTSSRSAMGYSRVSTSTPISGERSKQLDYTPPNRD
jgi:hypothetical protein